MVFSGKHHPIFGKKCVVWWIIIQLFSRKHCAQWTFSHPKNGEIQQTSTWNWQTIANAKQKVVLFVSPLHLSRDLAAKGPREPQFSDGMFAQGRLVFTCIVLVWNCDIMVKDVEVHAPIATLLLKGLGNFRSWSVESEDVEFPQWVSRHQTHLLVCKAGHRPWSFEWELLPLGTLLTSWQSHVALKRFQDEANWFQYIPKYSTTVNPG